MSINIGEELLKYKRELEELENFSMVGDYCKLLETKKSLSEQLAAIEKQMALIGKKEEVARYRELLLLITELEDTNKSQRDESFLNRVLECDHIFYTHLDSKGQTKTTCLKCGLTSNSKDFKGLSEPYKECLIRLIISLFQEGKSFDYTHVSDEFTSLPEAKSYYQQALEVIGLYSGPSDIVAKMLQLKNIYGPRRP
ncbi:MAG TPA: hypothetical protein PLX66_01325 [Bacilli bacterium]|nr:hypothetical protein [Bacilli bacterium]